MVLALISAILETLIRVVHYLLVVCLKSCLRVKLPATVLASSVFLGFVRNHGLPTVKIAVAFATIVMVIAVVFVLIQILLLAKGAVASWKVARKHCWAGHFFDLCLRRGLILSCAGYFRL